MSWAFRVHVPDGIPPIGQFVEATHFEPCWTVPEIQTHCEFTQAEKGDVQS